MATTESLLSTELEVVASTDSDTAVNLDADNIMRSLYLVIGILGMGGNLLVIVVMAQAPKLRKIPTNIFIINQSAIDFSAAFFIVLTSYIRDIDSIRSLTGREAFCRLWMTNLPIWGLFVSSTYNLVALTFERFFAVVHPVWHMKSCTIKTGVVMSIPVVWVVGLGYNAAYMIPTAGIVNGACTVYSEYPNELTQRAVGVFTVFLQFFLPLILITYAYTKIALALRARISATTATATGGANQTATQRREEKMLRASNNVIRTLLIVCVCFILCWSCNQIYYTMYNLGFNADFNSAFYHFTVIAVFVNCCINPFIYSLKYEEFQNQLLKLFRCRRSMAGNDSLTDQTVTA